MWKKIERKLGKYAIKNLSLYIVFTYILGYLLALISPELIEYIQLNPVLVLQGQVWRIITWVLIPPSSFSIFIIITLFFYYSIGKALERAMGDFAYNIYIFGGILITLITTFVMYFLAPLMGFIYTGNPSTYYISMSIFLAFAAVFPDMQVLLFFFIPIKVKWLAYLDVAFLIVQIIVGNASIRVMIISSLANFIIFLLIRKKSSAKTPFDYIRKKNYQSQSRPKPNITKHKCAVCNRTERDGDLTFRFCSKCNGNFEYCSDHIYSHEHVK